MSTQRKRYSAAFKARVALAARKGLQTVNALARTAGVHPTRIAHGNHRLQQELPEIVSVRRAKPEKECYHKAGERSAWQKGGYRRSRVAGMERRIRAWLQDTPAMTLAELCAHLAEHKVTIKTTALWHQLNHWKLSLKKTLHASEPERADVQAKRAEWKASQAALEVATLVFLDETGASTNMTRTRGRAPVGKRCVASVPHGHWKTTTCIAGWRVGAVTAPMVLAGPRDGEAFLVSVKAFLCPTRSPGDIVIADNLSSHKGKAARRAMEATGATLRRLPPYSPDLNPIEKLFSKLKAMLRKAAHRTLVALWQEIGDILDTFSPDECANDFQSSGYRV